MTNVCRIFNDRVGAELVERTGKNPQYEYIQLGCSQRAVQRMLHYARTKCVGRPFSQMGMARSILWPRQTDSSSFFCAELVAAVLKEGGLMEQSSNPGGATPEILYRLYKGRAALVGNPCVLRDMQQQGTGMQFASIGSSAGTGDMLAAQERRDEREALLQRQAVMAPMHGVGSPAATPTHAVPRTACAPCASYATCAPRSGAGSATGAFRQIGGAPLPPQGGGCGAAAAAARGGGLALTFNGLTMSGQSGHRRH